jgi:hypothetical protein
MSEAPSPQPQPAPQPAAVRGRRPPAWGIGLFLLLLAGFVLVNHRLSTGGKPIAWIDNDLTAAVKQAETEKRKVFLYLYEPNDPTHARNELQVFTQRWARKPLEHVVCCRVVLGPGDPLRFRYKCDGKPLFLLLDAKGNVLSRVEGAVDELQFFTYIGTIAERE